jgi:magnesium transporter
MIRVYCCPNIEQTESLNAHLLKPHEALTEGALWIDMIEPTREEDRKVEGYLGISIPTREEMKDIEPSELLWNEDGATYMTGRLLYRAETDEPSLCGVTFILKGQTLVTVRYEEPRAFAMFTSRICRHGSAILTHEGLLGGLIETIIDRASDVLQDAGDKIDGLSRRVFADKSDVGQRHEEYQYVLRRLGSLADLTSKQRESMVSIERILLFLSAHYRTARVPVELREAIRAAMRDVQSLEEHASFLSNKIQFLLDATLGLVNLDQNNIIKLFSVMAVIFMPPTLIASIYGMNFKHMPELGWDFGYPAALFLMILAAIVPYMLFRLKKWL